MSARTVVTVSALVLAVLAMLAVYGLRQPAAGDAVQLEAATALPQPRASDLQKVLLSVDPLRDDPATLAAYVGHFGTRFLGVTGEPAEIDRLMAGLGLAYIKVPGAAGSHTVDHSTALALVDPQGRVAAYFRPPFRADAMISDLAALAGSAP